jgi:hypothetical protein
MMGSHKFLPVARQKIPFWGKMMQVRDEAANVNERRISFLQMRLKTAPWKDANPKNWFQFFVRSVATADYLRNKATKVLWA